MDSQSNIAIFLSKVFVVELLTCWQIHQSLHRSLLLKCLDVVLRI